MDHSLAGESSTSAIDLTGTPAGLGSSVPPSPALIPRESLPRRRLSWGRMDATHDPLRFDAADVEPPRINTGPANHSGWTAHDDPFYSPTTGDSPPFAHTFSYQSGGRGTYSTAQPGPSSASLISRGTDGTGTPDDDDQVALTGNMSRPGSSGWRQSTDVDPESSAVTRRSRKTVRYSASPSPLRKTGNRLATISRNIRRASIRVVNMAGIGVDEHVRLGDTEDEKQQARDDEDEEEKEHDEDAILDLSRALPIRGRTLGFMGPANKLRLAMYKFLIYPWTEPIILLLIVINAVVLTIQAAPNIAPSEDGERYQPVGYFQEWEDYALFGLFCIFT